MQQFDLIIIGSGPAGYTGAIRAAQLGMRVACIEYRETLGGTCLNVGCIPSKALLNFSEKYEEASKSFANIGIQTEVKLNLSTMMSKKNQIVSDLCKGISGLFTKNKIIRFFGKGSFISPSIIEIASDQGKEQISAKNILIATGSRVIELPNVEIDEKQIVSSSGILNLQKVPQHLVVVGGGYIGIELGSVWRRLGAKVTVVEYGDKLVPMLDEEVGSQFTKIIVKQGIELKLSTKVLKAEKKAGKVSLQIQRSSDNELEEIVADVVLVSIGRKPNSENLGLDKVGIVTDKTGRIEVNDKFQTRLTNIYAVGDVIKGPMLAHKAEEEAIAAVEIMAGGAGHVNYNLIPSVIYTHPEVASIGKTEQQLKEAGIEYKVGKFPFLANSRARTMLETDGVVKLLADKKTDELLGAHIIGPQAGSQIAELTAYMEFKASAEDIARTCHAHPTLNEAIKEAALAVDKRAINF